MNNWRLLLLAAVAVFQPIASFTESNLIDGRQQCCDRLSSAPLQDTRSSLHGTYWHGKTALRRLNNQDESREDRRYELRQRVSIFSRSSSERPLVDIRGRVARQSPSEIARSSRVEFRLERSAISPSRERLLDVNQREETQTRNLQTQDRTRRVVDHNSRNAIERRNVRIYTGSPHESLFRNDYRTERFGNERLSQREIQREQFRSVERRITLNGAARRVLSRTQDDVPNIEASMNNQRIARERLSVVRRESTIRPDTRLNTERNDERRDFRNNEQRRSLTENTRLVGQIRDMRIRLNAREDHRENRQRESPNQRLSTERFEERREQREDRSSRQQNKENIDRTSSNERRMQMARRITRESRIINVMTGQNERNVDYRREIRHNERMSREIQDDIRENPDHRFSSERILMDRRNIRESRIINVRNKRAVTDERVIKHNERMSRETQDENRENRGVTLSRERIQMDRRNVRESRMINAQNTREIDGRREIRHTERFTRETRGQDREEALSRERIQMDRRNIRETRIMNSQNTRDVAELREIRPNERMTRETGDENRDNRRETLSRERIQMDRRNILEPRMMNALNKRQIDGRREIRHNERLTRETREEIKDNLEQRLSRERILDRRDTRDSRNTNTRNVRTEDDRREIRHNERNTRENERENHINRLSVERTQVDRNNIREFRVINNLITRDDDRRIDSKTKTKFNNRVSRETRDGNRVNFDNRLSLERIQIEKRNIPEFRTVNTPNDQGIDSRREIRYNERSTELRKEARVSPEQRISQERIQMDRMNIREFRNINIFVRNERDTEGRKVMRTDSRLHTENRVNPDHRLSRERIEMSRRNNRESRIENRLTRESREEMRENPDRRITLESRQVDRRNIRKSGVNRAATRDERSIEVDTENRREIRNQISREPRVESRSVDRLTAEDRDSSMMDRRVRSADRRNYREIRAEPRLSRSTDSERRTEVFRSRVEHSNKIENREREAINARSRNLEMARNRERISAEMVGNMETDENHYTVANWQYVLYTLQAAYLCALFMQMLTPRHTDKTHKMSLRWLPVSSHYNPIKMD